MRGRGSASIPCLPRKISINMVQSVRDVICKVILPPLTDIQARPFSAYSVILGYSLSPHSLRLDCLVHTHSDSHIAHPHTIHNIIRLWYQSFPCKSVRVSFTLYASDTCSWRMSWDLEGTKMHRNIHLRPALEPYRHTRLICTMTTALPLEYRSV